VEKSFEQAMMALNLQSAALTQFREDDSMVFLVFHKRWPLAGKLLPQRTHCPVRVFTRVQTPDASRFLTFRCSISVFQ
jgi:hypothetical protein